MLLLSELQLAAKKTLLFLVLLNSMKSSFYFLLIDKIFMIIATRDLEPRSMLCLRRTFKNLKWSDLLNSKKPSFYFAY